MADSKSLELQIRIATQEALKAVETLKGEVKALANEASKYAKSEGEALKNSFKEAETAAKQSSQSIFDIKKALGSLTEVVAATKALNLIKDMGAFALQTADNFQTAKNQFGVLLGDMEAGAGLFNEIKAFNDKTPFDLSTLTQATNVLIAAKVPLQDLQDQLAKFGDLSQGNSQRMTSYVNAFSQAAAKGKADMQVLNTYLHQGVPILDALAKNFGVTTAEIVEMSSKGQISFADFSQALDDLTAAGGQYFGGMELASQSLAAMQEGLQEAVNSLGASFGEMLLPAAIAVTGALTEITNAINESPIAKGIFAAMLSGISVYLAAMAVKAGIAFAAQMALNLSIGALNPVVLASTIAVAGLAAGYTIYAANAQKAARASEDNALALKKEVSVFDEYINTLRNADNTVLINEINAARQEIEAMSEDIVYYNDLRERAWRSGNADREDYYNDIIESLNREIEFAQNSITAIQKIINERNAPLDKNAKKEAEKWFQQWAEQYRKFKGEMENDPFISLNIDLEKTMAEAIKHGASREIINQINEYYASERSKIIKQLADEEERLAASISKTKIDDLELQFQKELEAINKLERQRIIAAGNSEEEIAAIRARFAQMREDMEINLTIEINKTKLDEARESVKNWQEELSDSLLKGLMDLQMFSDQASVILSDLSAQFIELSSSAMLSGFTEFGRAMGMGKDAAESLQQALAHMCRQILDQLPMMFLQAGLQLIAQGQWALGLGFIAAAGSSAIVSGYVQGKTEEATKHAHGGVFEEYGQAARAFAAGGTFTNRIVQQPTYFRYGGSLGVMGEAGPEAILPLKRMTSGNLGVEAGGERNTFVYVNIINNSGEDVQKEESTDADGNQQIDVIIGTLINSHITSGKADPAMRRYGLKAAGV